MAETKIEWTATVADDGTVIPGFSFNSWLGCTKVSPACDHCYAESWAKRTGSPELWSGERRRTRPAYWKQPLKWDREAEAAGRRARVFCASLADVFDNQVPAAWRQDLWELIEATPHLDWLLLTKRPQNIRKMLPDPRTGVQPWGDGWPNVWLGTTAEDQAEADRRIPKLLDVPAAVHFVSAEPLLGPIDFRFGVHHHPANNIKNPAVQALVAASRKRLGPTLDWVIAGSESGHGARPCDLDWVRGIRDQCTAAGVPFFWKQHALSGRKISIPELDGQKWVELPHSLSA